MDIRVLGTFEVMDGDGTVVTPSAPKLRRVLALLAVRAGTLVHASQLVDELWEDRPPASASTTLQTYIYQLRKLLALGEHGQAATLQTRPSGYLLNLPARSLDRVRFDELSARGTAELREGCVERAAQTLREALDLWRGPALSDIEQGPHLQAEVVHLEECRNSVLELRVDADLALGRHQQLISELTALTARNATHEGMHGRLMLALYRSGRRGEALQAYHRVRAALAEELGLEPGPELQRIHQCVLNADPALDSYGGAPVTTGGTPAVATAPAQLPPDAALVGRDAELSRVERLLADGAEAPVAICVSGAPGVGTTAFCVHAAHRVRAAYPDGQFFATLSESVTPAAVLGDFLRAIGVPAEDLPPGPAARAAMFRSWAADRRVLVVVDNVVNASQLLPLLPSAPGCATIAGCDRPLFDPAIHHQIALDPLPANASADLLGLVVGRDRVTADPEATRTLVEVCGGLPVVLLAAAHTLALRPHWPVAHLARRLADRPESVRELRAGDPHIEDSVMRRYRLLPGTHRTVLREMVGAGGRPMSAWEIGATLHIDEYAAETALEQLVEYQLAEVEDGAGTPVFRYRLRPLVHLVVRALRREDRSPVASRSLVAAG